MKATIRNISILSIFLFLLTSAPACFAELKQDLNHCLKIESNIARLDCYDMRVRKISITPSEIEVSAEIKEIEIKKSKIIKTSKAKLIKPDNSNSNFGLKIEEKATKVESFLVGEFSSWEKGMKLKLKNGQVWKVINSPRGYKKINNPAITITLGFLGSYNAKIEGLNSRAKVKRIK